MFKPRARRGWGGREGSQTPGDPKGSADSAVAAAVAPSPQVGVFLENGFFTIGPQNRDLGALLPGKDSYGHPASFLF